MEVAQGHTASQGAIPGFELKQSGSKTTMLVPVRYKGTPSKEKTSLVNSKLTAVFLTDVKKIKDQIINNSLKSFSLSCILTFPKESHKHRLGKTILSNQHLHNASMCQPVVLAICQTPWAPQGKDYPCPHFPRTWHKNVYWLSHLSNHWSTLSLPLSWVKLEYFTQIQIFSYGLNVLCLSC